MSTSRYVYAFDIGATTIKAGVVTPSGEILSRKTVNTQGNNTNKEFLDVIYGLLQKLHQDHPTPLAVGIGSPGPLDLNEGVIAASANMPGIKNCAITMALSQKMTSLGQEVQVFLNNDANCAALGQYHFGLGRNEPNFATITLGTGVGGGLIFGGHLFNGYQGNGFEVGHIPITLPFFNTTVTEQNLPLRKCGCGALGCLETIASATGLAASYDELKQLPAHSPKFTAKEIAHAADQGDKAALAAFEIMGAALGLLLITLVQTLNLPLFILTGGVAAASRHFMPTLEKTLFEHIFPIFHERTRVLCTAGDQNAGILGAAALCF